MRITSAITAIALAWGCGGDSDTGPDASSLTDATPGGGGDALADGGRGLFTISGDCGVLDVELTDEAPHAFDNVLAFDHAYSEDDEELLSGGGMTILAEGNAGGSSIVSEIFAFEVLNQCEAMTLLKTETAIVYDGPSKKTDFLAEKDGVRVGVSVTRAQTFPLGGDLTEQAATELLDGKLADILESSANVSDGDRWEKQILAVLVYNRAHLESLVAALPAIGAATRADTIVWMTVTDGPDDPVYQ